MNIQTDDGIEIQCLPDGARCEIEDKEIVDMDECPMKNFDNYGDICIPNLCEHYRECWLRG